MLKTEIPFTSFLCINKLAHLLNQKPIDTSTENEKDHTANWTDPATSVITFVRIEHWNLQQTKRKLDFGNKMKIQTNDEW